MLNRGLLPFLHLPIRETFAMIAIVLVAFRRAGDWNDLSATHSRRLTLIGGSREVAWRRIGRGLRQKVGQRSRTLF